MIKLMKALCVGIGVILAVVVSGVVYMDHFGATLYFICAAVIAVVTSGVGIIGMPRRTFTTFVAYLGLGVGCGLLWPVVASVGLLLLGFVDVIQGLLNHQIKAVQAELSRATVAHGALSQAESSSPTTALEARLDAMDGDQMVDLIDDFVGAPDGVRARLQDLGWSEMEVIHFGALIKTAAQHRLIDGNAWRGRIKSA